MVSRRWTASAAALPLLAAALSLTSCAEDYNDTETAEWLRVAGNDDETPGQIDCVAKAMHELLSDDELALWMAQDPESMTVEGIQSLPRAIDIADRCRHLM